MKDLKLFNFIKKYVGMRNFKTALSVVVSVLFANAFNLQSPFFVATGALFSMETTVEKGIHSGIYRVLGTIIGCIIGILMVTIDQGSIFLLFIGIIILISVLNCFKLHDCISIACVVFCVIMLTMTDENIVTYGIQRTIDTIFGIIIATVINYIIVKPE